MITLTVTLVTNGADRPSGSGSKPKVVRTGYPLICIFIPRGSPGEGGFSLKGTTQNAVDEGCRNMAPCCHFAPSLVRACRNQFQLPQANLADRGNWLIPKRKVLHAIRCLEAGDFCAFQTRVAVFDADPPRSGQKGRESLPLCYRNWTHARYPDRFLAPKCATRP